MARGLNEDCWKMVFQKLPTDDQLVVSQMGPENADLVRSANRKVKTLVITSLARREVVEREVSTLSLAFKPSMQLALTSGQVEPFADYPSTTGHPSKWGYLELLPDQLLDLQTIELIVKVFSAVTDLKFFGHDSVSCINLTALLQQPTWRLQLTNLMVHWPLYEEFSSDPPTVGQMITGINDLSALQCLAMKWRGGENLPVELTILAQLRFVVIDKYISSYRALLPSLNHHAAGNDNLNLFLTPHSKAQRRLFFNNPLSRRLARFQVSDTFNITDNLHALCGQCLSLTSIGVHVDEEAEVAPLFTALAQLPRLVHLKMVYLRFLSRQNNQADAPEFPLASMPSVRALDLNLNISSHSQVNLLNLGQTMPRLQAIHVVNLRCAHCNVSYLDNNYVNVRMYSEQTNPNLATAIECFRSTLGQLHPNVPYDRIILGNINQLSTLRQLLAANERQ